MLKEDCQWTELHTVTSRVGQFLADARQGNAADVMLVREVNNHPVLRASLNFYLHNDNVLETPHTFLSYSRNWFPYFLAFLIEQKPIISTPGHIFTNPTMGKTRGSSADPRSKLSYIQQSPRGHPSLTVLLIYPLTLILGSLYSVISPTARPSQSDPLKVAIPADPTISGSTDPVNYFAKKNNIFNLYFVKVGWAWLTLAFVILLITQPAFISASTISSTINSLDSGNNSVTKAEASASSTPTTTPTLSPRPRRVFQALIRYAIATTAWILTTQWFFGPAIIDRTFALTGGKCEAIQRELASGVAAQEAPIVDFTLALSAAACKSAGGAWRGGHDVSGHVFMLVLATAFLAFETLGSSSCSQPSLSFEVVDNHHNEKEIATAREVSWIKKWSLRFIWSVTVLDWWMLLMTAIWFHTWFEKVSIYKFPPFFFVLN
jgi:hypothetical protein